MRRISLLLGSLIIFVAFNSVFSQESIPSQPDFKMSISVSVTDGNGHAVTELTKEDFSIIEVISKLGK